LQAGIFGLYSGNHDRRYPEIEAHQVLATGFPAIPFPAGSRGTRIGQQHMSGMQPQTPPGIWLQSLPCVRVESLWMMIDCRGWFSWNADWLPRIVFMGADSLPRMID